MARKALIETATGKVANIIELEDGANWQPPLGQYIRDALNANPGDTWDGTKFLPRPPTPEEIKAAKVEVVKQRFLASIAVQTSPPWSDLLKDLAVVLGLTEPK